MLLELIRHLSQAIFPLILLSCHSISVTNHSRLHSCSHQRTNNWCRCVVHASGSVKGGSEAAYFWPADWLLESTETQPSGAGSQAPLSRRVNRGAFHDSGPPSQPTQTRTFIKTGKEGSTFVKDLGFWLRFLTMIWQIIRKYLILWREAEMGKRISNESTHTNGLRDDSGNK